jgi:hypothetical protein
MAVKSISSPAFYDADRNLRLSLAISPKRTLKLECFIERVNETWTVNASAVCIISQNQKNLSGTFRCQLPPLVLQPMDVRVLGAWREVFMKDYYWPFPPLIREDNSSELDPLEGLEEYANQDLLQISAYRNGFTVRSDSLQLESD